MHQEISQAAAGSPSAAQMDFKAQGFCRKSSAASWHRVVQIPFVERMAAQHAPQGKITAFERAVFFDCLHGIGGTRGRKTAAGRMHGTDVAAVKPDKRQQQALDHVIPPAFLVAVCSGGSGSSRFCLRSRLYMVRQSLSKSASAAGWRAMKTYSPFFILGKSGAQAALSLRLTRLRLTAQPSFFPTEKPTFSAPERTYSSTISWEPPDVPRR